MTNDEMLDELSVLYERFKNGMGWRDGRYEEALEKAIEILEEAIPIEWIEKYIWGADTHEEKRALRKMYAQWEKENEHKESD